MTLVGAYGEELTESGIQAAPNICSRTQNFKCGDHIMYICCSLSLSSVFLSLSKQVLLGNHMIQFLWLASPVQSG